MILTLYRGLTSLGAPLISHYLKKRMKRGKEHPTRFPERLGQASVARPDGKLLWLHGASVGESISLLPLIDAIATTYPNYSILMTTGTVTSAALMEKRLPKGVIHQFIPVDRFPYVRSFLDHWKPDVAIWAESELWPNLITKTHRRGTKMALINARMSERSLHKWQKVRGFIAELLSCFDLCLAQTEKDVAHYRLLGADHVSCAGNLKYASPDLPFDPEDLKALQEMVASRPLWMAASTHPGEEAVMARVHQALKKKYPDILTIIAPRHPERGNDIRAEMQCQGLNIKQRSLHETPNAQTDVYLCDTMGEMGLLYRLSSIVFMGKSLQPLGGQNPLEPARLDCAVLCGPYMDNFAEIMTSLRDGNGVLTVQDEADLITQIDHLLANPQQVKSLADNAKKTAHAKASVLDHTLRGLAPLFGGRS